MTTGFEGKSVMVTGAASGIGRAVATAAATQGALVTVLDVDDTQGVSVAAEVGGRFMQLDVSDPDAWAQLVRDIDVPDYVHLNAGVMARPASEPLTTSDILTVDLESYRRVMSINVDGVLHGIRALAPLMKAKGGVITVTASIAGLVPVPFDIAYSMSKHALIALVRALAETWEGTNMKINAICPGGVHTAIVPDELREIISMSPDVMAAEVIDLLLTGSNGETRVKLAADLPARAIPAPEL